MYLIDVIFKQRKRAHIFENYHIKMALNQMCILITYESLSCCGISKIPLGKNQRIVKNYSSY